MELEQVIEIIDKDIERLQDRVDFYQDRRDIAKNKREYNAMWERMEHMTQRIHEARTLRARIIKGWKHSSDAL